MLFISIGDLDDQSTVKPKQSPNPKEEIELRQRRPDGGISSMGGKKSNKSKKILLIYYYLCSFYVTYCERRDRS